MSRFQQQQKITRCEKKQKCIDHTWGRGAVTTNHEEDGLTRQRLNQL